MAVVDKSEKIEEIEDAAETQKRLEEKFIEDLKGDQNADQPDKKGDVEGEGQKTEEESETEEQTEETEDTKKESETEEEEKEDPKQARINELTAEKRRLEAQLKRLEASPKTSEDPERQRLEKMSIEELRTLKKEVRMAWKVETDETKSRKLMELEDKIDETVSQGPQRFERQQLAQYQIALQSTVDELGDRFTEDLQKKCYARAKAIYEKYPSLQRDIDGQAIAWQQAVDFYKDTSKMSVSKEKSLELERENNKLKKKVTLDTAVSKGAQKGNEEDRLFKAAKGGDKKSELEFFKKTLNL